MFASIMSRLRKLVRDENGPTAVEYAVMLALIIILCLAAIRAIGTSTNQSLNSTSNALNKSVNGT